MATRKWPQLTDIVSTQLAGRYGILSYHVFLVDPISSTELFVGYTPGGQPQKYTLATNIQVHWRSSRTRESVSSPSEQTCLTIPLLAACSCGYNPSSKVAGHESPSKPAGMHENYAPCSHMVFGFASLNQFGGFRLRCPAILTCMFENPNNDQRIPPPQFGAKQFSSWCP